MKKRLLATILTSIIILLLLFNLYLYLDSKKVLEVYNINADVNITYNKTAFKLTKDNILHFGSLPYTGKFSSTRTLTFNNTYPFDIKVFLKNNGPEWVYFSNNNFILKPNENKSIDVIINPKNVTTKLYSWNITVIIKKA